MSSKRVKDESITGKFTIGRNSSFLYPLGYDLNEEFLTLPHTETYLPFQNSSIQMMFIQFKTSVLMRDIN